MEEIIPLLKDMLKSSIEIKKNEGNLLISLIIKRDIKGNLAKPEEVIIMLKMFGGLREDIPVDIKINNEKQYIDLQFENKEDFKTISLMMDKIWDNAVEMFIEVINGNYKAIKDIPEIED